MFNRRGALPESLKEKSSWLGSLKEKEGLPACSKETGGVPDCINKKVAWPIRLKEELA